MNQERFEFLEPDISLERSDEEEQEFKEWEGRQMNLQEVMT